MLPKNISKEHIEKAIEEIDKNGVRKGRHSSTYDLLFNGKSYPPKLVLSIANKYANGAELDPNTFEGGKDTPAFELIRSAGFEIAPKIDPVKSLIEGYKKKISETELQDETYKWELLDNYKGRPNINAIDFYQEIKDIKFKNLIYAMGVAVIHQLAKEKPEELRMLFINLFDETIDLTARVKSFNSGTLKIYRELGETLQHHQDERSIATYLTFHNSEKYTFYKSTCYKKYCRLIGVKEAKKNEKYSHYLTLIDDLIENYITPDTELVDQVKELIPDYYNGSSQKLLAQDILFQMLDKKQEVNYWVFQGNPKFYDFETALKDEILKDWTISAHKNKIKVGDKLIIWITGSKSGCYALAEVTNEPYPKTSSTDDYLWKEEDKSEFKAEIKITHNLVDSPILKSKVDSMNELRNLKVGNQGTNFSATKDEYDCLLSLITNEVKESYWLYAPGENARNWQEFYNNGVMGLGWDEIGDLNQYHSRDEIKTALIKAYGGKGSKKNDVSANDDFLNKINIGDIIIAKKGRGELLGYGIVASKYLYDKSRSEYKSIRQIDWKVKGNWKVDFSLVLKTLTDITKMKSDHPHYDYYYERLLGIMGVELKDKDNRESFEIWLAKKYGENSGTSSSYIKAIDILSLILSKDLFKTSEDNYLETLYKDLINEQRNQTGKYFHSDAPSYGTHGFYSASIKSYREFLQSRNEKTNNAINHFMNFPLNTILYGPPGTGKTYNTVLRAAEIIENRKISSYDEALDIFKANLHEQIEFITFHQNYSYEDFIQGLRPDTENDNQLTFDRKDGVFKVLADKALQNLEDSERPLIAKKTFEEAFNEFINPLVEGEVEEIEVKMKKVSYFITAISNKSIDFKKASGDSSHTLSIGTLKKMYTAESILDIQGLASYYAPLIESLLMIGKDSSGKIAEIERKNFVIIIDEINRANISRVFGELITLIEPDKRSHGSIPMEAKLPSGDNFVVPSNLYIIGTMNTADKSIALLDIALRRRFEFEAMYPKYEIEGQEIYDVEILKKINEQVIKSKGHDFQIGHAYFMGDNKDLLQRMNKRVIPLLLEYYMNDEKEVKGILNSAGLVIEENSWPLKILGKND